MRVVIDRENCVNCGTCWETCPDIFEEDPEDSHSRVLEKIRVMGDKARGELPEDQVECAVRAADECCAAVIQVEDE